MPDKKLERYYLEKFRQCNVDLPVTEGIEQETPDIRWDTEIGGFGIEITTFHVPVNAGSRPSQEIQALKERIVKTAKERYRGAGGKALYVTVFFRREQNLRKNRVKEIAESLANAISSCDLSGDDPLIEYRVPHQSLPDVVGQICIYNSVDGNDELWHPDGGGWVYPVTQLDIQREIDRKNAIAATIKKSCTEAWLLIAEDIFRQGTPSEISSEAISSSYSYDFDKVFWLQPNMPRAFELRKQFSDS